MTIKVSVKNLSLDIPIIGPERSFRTTIKNKYIGGQLNASGNSVVSVAALKNINFNLHSGDRLALVGHNGAGKSTLLYALAGIYKPMLGEIKCNGKVTPLFNVSPGLDKDDTGIENIYTICTYFGLSKAEIDQRLEDIISFTELQDYINLPIKSYSNGMLARLGFAVATSIEPDILLLDEGITVGDQRFAHKAKERLESFLNKIDVVVCASHSEQLIRDLCNKAMLLDHGVVKYFGSVDEAFEIYNEMQAEAN